MHYERTRQIEQRFKRTITLIKKNSHNAQQLAKTLGVSRPTMQRIITELRHRGYPIRAVRDDRGWRYELIGKS